MKIFRNPQTIHPPLGAYSHQVMVSGPQRWLILSGQVGQLKDGTTPDDPMEQLAIALCNISQNLHSAGMAVQDIVKLTFYLSGPFDAAKRKETVKNWLNGHQPAMTLIFVAGLATPQLKVEIDALACSDERGESESPSKTD